jgi:beta-glucosidase
VLGALVAAGRRRTVTIPLDASSFSYWHSAAGSWRIAPGCDRIVVGTSSRELPLQRTVCPR